ncbi:MAG TPA: hypothetical protein VN914_19285, partial [Polyangia bacterium]|nr:hypothetical protein [Polyangia bacterium]
MGCASRRQADDLDASQSIQTQALTLESYDDFEGALSSGKWHVRVGTPTTSGGRFVSNAQSSAMEMESAERFD